MRVQVMRNNAIDVKKALDYLWSIRNVVAVSPQAMRLWKAIRIFERECSTILNWTTSVFVDKSNVGVNFLLERIKALKLISFIMKMFYRTSIFVRAGGRSISEDQNIVRHFVEDLLSHHATSTHGLEDKTSVTCLFGSNNLNGNC